MITAIKVNALENFPHKDFLLGNIKKKNIIVARNGYGKTTLFKGIRDWINNEDRDSVDLEFTKDFIDNPKHVYFTLPEELDGRAIQSSISPFEASSFIPKTVKYMEMSEMSSGQEQRDILTMFRDNAIYDGCIWFIDEPEKSLDVVELNKFIKYILKADVQVFINTHSETLLKDSRFNRIVLDEDYFDKAKKILHLD